MEKRQAELDELVNVKMKQNAIAIGEAAAKGDLSENSEYKFALEERDLLRARVAVIQNELGMAQVLTANDISTEQVNIGTRVQLRRRDGQETRDLTILGPFEASLEERIYNYRAPLPTRLKGMKPGDVVSLEFDEGEHEYTIESIANALDA
jgi:transcription elongation GreA/GreB family factor